MGQILIRLLAGLAALLVLSQQTASAQALSQPVTIQYVGTITGSAADTLTIGGKPWTGPLPDFPYVKGDQITVSFTAQPDGYKSPTAVDGIYRYSIVSRQQTGGTGLGIGLMSGLDVSGPINPGGLTQGANGLVLVYNSNTGTYSLEMPSNQFTLFQFDGPSYVYDPTANSVGLTSSSSQPGYPGCSDQGIGCFNISGGMNDASIPQAPVFAADGSVRGFWSMLFSGDWFVNGVKQGGGATDVPEPGQLGMMALALLPLLARQRGRLLSR